MTSLKVAPQSLLPRLLMVPLVVALAACTQSAPTGGKSGASPSPSSSAGALAFSQCMRHNGLPNYPDPDPATGTVDQSTINKADPTYQKAVRACQSKLPAGRQSAKPPTTTEMAKWKQFAQCMRGNGLPDFPDPDPNGGFGQNGGGVDRTSPTFQKAFQKCQDKAPKGGS